MDVLHEDLLHRLLQSLPGRAWCSLGAATRATRSPGGAEPGEANADGLPLRGWGCW